MGCRSPSPRSEAALPSGPVAVAGAGAAAGLRGRLLAWAGALAGGVRLQVPGAFVRVLQRGARV